MDNVSTSDLKEVRINVKISPKLRADFQTAARLRGATMSALIHQFIVKTVREERERDPGEFLPVSNRGKAAESGQVYLHSEWAGSKKTTSRSRKINKDVQDIKSVAKSETRKKKQ
jgi:hypothetical protein